MASSLESALRSVAVDPDRPSRRFRGPWGCLVVAGQPYPGFDVVETDRYLIVVVGGPLPRYDDDVADGSKADDGTRWILHEWKVAQRLHWDDDLVGHFAVICIDKRRNQVEAVTDIDSFVPLYSASNVTRPKETVLGTHADAVAIASGRLDVVDSVSVADFIAYTTVTYPYTLYLGVVQLRPASVHCASEGVMRSSSYWEPREENPPGSFIECADMLRERLLENVRRVCLGQIAVGLLMSAGEDSRVAATVARQYSHVEARTFAETYNREARLAERVAVQLGISWQMLQRRPTHYLDQLPSVLYLCESQRLFVHSHSMGLMQDWPCDTRVLGGHLADSFAKGLYVPCSGLWAVPQDAERLSPEAVWMARWTGQPIERRLLDHMHHQTGIDLSGHREDAIARRAQHAAFLRELRPTTWHEWCRLWPASQLTSLGSFAVNRRLFSLYEPFMDASMLRLLASCPQRWKLRRRLFHAAMKPILADTRWVPHSSGIYPYWSYAANVPFRAAGNARRGIHALYRLVGRPRPNDGPWPYPSETCASEAFRAQLATLELAQQRGAYECDGVNLRAVARCGNPMERLAALQLLHWSKWRADEGQRTGA